MNLITSNYKNFLKFELSPPKKCFLLSLIFYQLFMLPNAAAVENFPFPQENSHYGIKPNVTQTQMNTSITSAYDDWKTNYLTSANSGGYFIFGADTDGLGKGTSESHGYGMLVMALMAGYDPNARTYFDGLYQFFDAHRSSINNELMGWFIDSAESGSGTYDSAADGDMDIAYALILADKQWGSDGTIDYRQEALDMINQGLKASILHPSSMRLMRGDWDTDQNSSRTSDWMTAHLKAYASVTGDNDWNLAADEIYQMINTITVNYASATGLMPDFVTGNPVAPNNNDDTGEQNSGSYYYNAARTPWRIATDYLHYGDIRAKDASDKLVDWARTKIGSPLNFDNYEAGYTLSGVSLGSGYSDIVFVAPLVVAATTSPTNQDFLDAGWQYISASTDAGYFGDTINLLSMLLISGNWWSPEADSSPETPSACTPYNGWTIDLPGTLNAVEYDVGNDGDCFHDTDTDNLGGSLRSDGVDIEASTLSGYNIGWIEPGEWQNYSVWVPEGGVYDVTFTVASEENGGNLNMSVSGEDKTGSLIIPSTGGWQNWQNITVTNVDITSGEHVVKISHLTGGYNIYSIKFVKK